uniref:Squalene cyclase C-terminal domain-containing protein n=1 Tax=Desulfovibrio sp. U5L TaxID=596152 RepID=I2Q5M4_9BACT
MDSNDLNPAYAALLARALPDGSFAVAPDAASRPDATAWAALALYAAGRAPDVVAGARKALARVQSPDGRVPILAERPEAAWPTSLALLAWRPDPALAGPVRSAAAWLAGHPGATWPKEEGGIFGHDPSLKGWSWIDGTHSWVEPTAQAILALSALAEPPAGALAEAGRMLLDRQLPDGGWNYGNTRVFRHMLLPIPECTGHALAALAVLPGGPPRQAVAKSLAYLAGPECAAATPLAAAWRAFGLGAYGQAGPEVLGNLRLALARQDRYGPYDTPLLAQLLAAAASGGRFEALWGGGTHEAA